MRTCIKCKEDLPLDAFGTNKARPDNTNVYCRRCNRERMQLSRAHNRARHRRKPAVVARRLKLTDKAEQAIEQGYGKWDTLRKKLQTTNDELGLVLVDLIFDKRSVRPRSINGERVYVKVA